MTNLKNKWVLITGASRGIGLHIARFMSDRGSNIILHSRSLEHTKDLLEEIKSKGVDCYAIEADLSDMNSVNSMLKKIEENGTDVDVLFNNAGIQVAYRNNYLETPVEDFTKSFEVNTITPMMLCYYFIPKMISKGFGRIINVTSGIDKDPQQAGYSASKAALDKITKDLSTKIDGTDVVLNLVDPGWCRTDLGGPRAPNSVEDSIPGMVVGAFVDDKKSGRLFRAQDFKGMSLEEALEKI